MTESCLKWGKVLKDYSRKWTRVKASRMVNPVGMSQNRRGHEPPCGVSTPV